MGRVGGAHDVADVDLAQAGAPVDRRDDVGVAENGVHVADGGLVGFDLRLLLRDERVLGIDLLLRDGERADLRVAVEVALRVGEQRLIERLFGYGLIVLRLVCHRVDVREHVALFHVLAFLEVDGEDLALHLRAHGDRIARLRRADAFEPHRDVRELRLGGDDRHRAVRAGSPPALALLLDAFGEMDGGIGERADHEDRNQRLEKLFHPTVLSLPIPRSDGASRRLCGV